MNGKHLFLICIFVLGVISIASIQYSHKETHTIKVLGKDRIVQPNGDSFDSFYLIYTDKGSFKLEDDIVYGNYYSSDIYGQIEKDSTYTITTVGYRSGVGSMYPNIVEIKKTPSW